MVENAQFRFEGQIVWPMLVDYSKSDCQRILRRLELEAYAKIVTVFRAQGPMTNEKRRTLEDLQRLLSITSERHKAEVRRALNDEELATICETICGKEAYHDWIMEGKRIAPILDRNIPQTAFLPKADIIASKWATINFKLQSPCNTAQKETESVHIDNIIHETNESTTLPIENIQTSQQCAAIQTDDATLFVDKIKDEISTPVPEAAMEVTCETNIPKPAQSNSSMEISPSMKPSQSAISGIHLVSDISMKSDAFKNSPLVTNQNHTVATQEIVTLNQVLFPKAFNDNEINQTLSTSHLIQSDVSRSPVTRKRAHTPHTFVVGSALEKLRQKYPSFPIDQSRVSNNTFHLNNGITPLISQSRGVVFRQNVKSVDNVSSIQSSQRGLQMTNVQGSLGNGVHRMPTSMTTVIVPGSSGPSAYVSQALTVATSPIQSHPASTRIMQSYPTFQQQNQSSMMQQPTTQQIINFGGQISQMGTVHLSASSILADSKKHSVMMQQQANAVPPPSGNVIVVHRAPSGRLLTSGPASMLHSGISYPTTVQATMASNTMGGNRQLRILSVPASIVSSTPSNTSSPSIHHQHQLSSRLSSVRNDSTLVHEKSSVLDGSNVNIITMPSLLRSSSTSSGSAMPIRSSETPVGSPCGTSANVLDPKRPRFAFVPSSQNL